jgi:hypothetical protein
MECRIVSKLALAHEIIQEAAYGRKLTLNAPRRQASAMTPSDKRPQRVRIEIAPILNGPTATKSSQILKVAAVVADRVRREAALVREMAEEALNPDLGF